MQTYWISHTGQQAFMPVTMPAYWAYQTGQQGRQFSPTEPPIQVSHKGPHRLLYRTTRPSIKAIGPAKHIYRGSRIGPHGLPVKLRACHAPTGSAEYLVKLDPQIIHSLLDRSTGSAIHFPLDRPQVLPYCTFSLR